MFLLTNVYIVLYITMFVNVSIADISWYTDNGLCIYIHIVCLRTKFHMHYRNGLLVIAMKSKRKENAYIYTLL
jgi:hypothetical protein